MKTPTTINTRKKKKPRQNQQANTPVLQPLTTAGRQTHGTYTSVTDGGTIKIMGTEQMAIVVVRENFGKNGPTSPFMKFIDQHIDVGGIGNFAFPRVRDGSKGVLRDQDHSYGWIKVRVVVQVVDGIDDGSGIFLRLITFGIETTTIVDDQHFNPFGLGVQFSSRGPAFLVDGRSGTNDVRMEMSEQ
jgi:hypothetical protein